MHQHLDNGIGEEGAKALGQQLGKLPHMHTLVLSSKCCRSRAGVVFVFEWRVVHEQVVTLATKERRHWLHSWARCRTCTSCSFQVRVMVYLRLMHVVYMFDWGMMYA